MSANSKEVISKLAKIDVTNPDPFLLFNEWHNRAKSYFSFMAAHAMNLATVSNEGVVSNRTVLLQFIKDGDFLFNTTKKSRKHNDIMGHPQVSLTFYWNCPDDAGCLTAHQVRIEGLAEAMPENFTREHFKTARNDYKMRAVLCQQGDVVEWDDLKKRHEALVEHAKNNELEMPEHAIFYRVQPYRMEFYLSPDNEVTIGDRVLFTKDDKNCWKFVHLEA